MNDSSAPLTRPLAAVASTNSVASPRVDLAAEDGRAPLLGRSRFTSAPLRVYRRSANAEALELMQTLLEDGAGTITFCKARVVAELIYKYLTENLKRRRADLIRRVRPYRGGYLPLERREIEQKLFTGELLGVCSTNALELGIDVGSLDASIIVGFPGTLCSLWQQAGRAGRRQDDSLSIFIAYDDPVDQYLMRNADFVFDRPLEHAIIDPENPHILAAQLGCAAFELPLGPADVGGDAAAFGPGAAEVAKVLEEEGRLRLTGVVGAVADGDGAVGAVAEREGVVGAVADVDSSSGNLTATPERSLRNKSPSATAPTRRYYWASAEFPAAQTNLRTISNATFAIVDVTAGRNTVIGQVDSISAPELVYPEAVYMHQGESYIVRELNLPARLARVERLDADYFTQPVLADDCHIELERLSGSVPAPESHGHVPREEGVDRGAAHLPNGALLAPGTRSHATLKGQISPGKKFFGDVTVKWQTTAFRKFKLYSLELIGQTVLNLPAQEVHTTGLWLQPPEHALAAARENAVAQDNELVGAPGTTTMDTKGTKGTTQTALNSQAKVDSVPPARPVHEALGGVRNLLVAALPPLAMCDRYDIGGSVNSSQLGVSTIILYDRYEGGVGFARHGYEYCEELLRLAWELVASCHCENGCPACVAPPNLHIAIHHDPDVGSGYAIPDKAATMRLLGAWLGTRG